MIRFTVDKLGVEIHPSKEELGTAAGGHAAILFQDAIAARGRARIIVGTGPSQNEVIQTVVSAPGIDWRRVEVFHMDEYAGVAADHPASFRLWLKTHVTDRTTPGATHYLNGDAPDWKRECARYSSLLAEAPIDLCFIGFGENGHIAFNDPHEADFNDPDLVKRVTLDEGCRSQQVGEGHFADLASVPMHALTLTCPALMSARFLVCSVPDKRKAGAVARALDGSVHPACPASIVRTHPAATLHLDPNSASLLTRRS